MADEQTAASENPQQQFGIQRIYMKDLSFEAPQGAALFTQPWKPAIHQEIGTRTSPLENDLHESVLILTITGKINDQPAFVVEVQQAGIFMIKGFSDEQVRQILGATCPGILFPYAREAVDSLMVKGTLPALNLPPINFEALFQQALAQQASQAAKDQTH